MRGIGQRHAPGPGRREMSLDVRGGRSRLNSRAIKWTRQVRSMRLSPVSLLLMLNVQVQPEETHRARPAAPGGMDGRAADWTRLSWRTVRPSGLCPLRLPLQSDRPRFERRHRSVDDGQVQRPDTCTHLREEVDVPGGVASQPQSVCRFVVDCGNAGAGICRDVDGLRWPFATPIPVGGCLRSMHRHAGPRRTAGNRRHVRRRSRPVCEPCARVFRCPHRPTAGSRLGAHGRFRESRARRRPRRHRA